MKSFTLTIVCLIAALKCLAQEDTTNIPFVSYWSVGDSYNYQITKIKRQWKEDKLDKDDSTSYFVNFEVIDSTETSYTIRWSFENELSLFNIPESVAGTFTKHRVTEVIYLTNELGEFLGIENWEVISKMMSELFIEVIEQYTDKEKRELMESIMKPILSIFNSKEGIENIAFKELKYFHFPFGVEYPASEPIFYQEELPNMFGGDPIKGDSKIYFESVDFSNSFCVMIQEMSLDPEDTKALITDLFKKMNLPDKDLVEAMNNAEFDIKDRNRFEYYYYPGVPYFIETSRETIIKVAGENGKRIEITRIKLDD